MCPFPYRCGYDQHDVNACTPSSPPCNASNPTPHACISNFSGVAKHTRLAIAKLTCCPWPPRYMYTCSTSVEPNLKPVLPHCLRHFEHFASPPVVEELKVKIQTQCLAGWRVVDACNCWAWSPLSFDSFDSSSNRVDSESEFEDAAWLLAARSAGSGRVAAGG